MAARTILGPMKMPAQRGPGAPSPGLGPDGTEQGLLEGRWSRLGTRCKEAQIPAAADAQRRCSELGPEGPAHPGRGSQEAGTSLGSPAPRG